MINTSPYKFYVYALSAALDFDTGALDLCRLCSLSKESTEHFLATNEEDIIRMQAYGFMVASKFSHWDGDIGSGFGFIPIMVDDTYLKYGFYWKQTNNGSTFFVSPVEMTHLKECLINTTKGE